MEDNRILIDQTTLEEDVRGVLPGFPYKADLADMHALPESTFPWHWHGEVELFYMREGAIEYHVPGRMEIFREGEAGFINSNVLHMTRAATPGPCIQEEHLYLPSFISCEPGDLVDLNYIQPIRQSGIDLFRFPPDSPAMDLMRRAYELFTVRPEGFELRIRALISELWLELFALTRVLHEPRAANPDDGRIKRMLTFIADHYAEPIRLADIAHAGLVGERDCYRIFRRCLSTTPLAYLTRHRLAQANILLHTTHRSILDISLSCGFNTPSYFTQLYRKHYATTPSKGRRGEA